MQHIFRIQHLVLCILACFMHECGVINTTTFTLLHDYPTALPYYPTTLLPYDPTTLLPYSNINLCAY